MKVIYYCYGSAHSSVVAAAIHLGHLPTEYIPDYKDIVALPDFDVARDDSLGHIFFKGKDERGNEIYTLGMGGEPDIVKRTLWGWIKESGADHRSFYFAAALPYLNRKGRLGGALSRRYGLVGIGRYLAAKGICESYERFVTFVQQTKNELEKQKRS